MNKHFAHGRHEKRITEGMRNTMVNEKGFEISSLLNVSLLFVFHFVLRVTQLYHITPLYV